MILRKKLQKFQFLPSKHPLKLAISGAEILPSRRTLITE